MRVGDHLLPLREVARCLSCDVRTVWRKISSGELPQPIKIGKQASLFASDLEAYFARLKRVRDGGSKEEKR